MTSKICEISCFLRLFGQKTKANGGKKVSNTLFLLKKCAKNALFQTNLSLFFAFFRKNGSKTKANNILYVIVVLVCFSKSLALVLTSRFSKKFLKKVRFFDKILAPLAKFSEGKHEKHQKSMFFSFPVFLYIYFFSFLCGDKRDTSSISFLALATCLRRTFLKNTKFAIFR